MGLLETGLLTAAVVVIDILIFKEYLRLEEELSRVKQITPISETEMQSMAQEVVAPLPAYKMSETTVFSSESELKSDVEKQNDQLKEENQQLTDAKKEMHNEKLDAIGATIDNILKTIKGARIKATG